MALRTSTGHKLRLLGEQGVETGANGFKGIYKNCVIDLYSGTQPATADSAATGTLLGRVTLNGGAFTEGVSTNGLVWDSTTTPGSAIKPSGSTWRATALADGTIGWFRVRGNATDSGASSSTLPRFDGTVGVSSGDLLLSVVNVTTGAPIDISTAAFNLA